MRAKIGFFIFMFLMQTSHDSPAATDSDVYAKALTLMERNQFEAAVYIMTPLAKTNPNTKLLLSLGDAYVALDQPKKALNYYILVYQHANQSDDQLFKRIALYKMARMQFWLGQYVSSGKTYQLLLTYPLSPLEHELALAGLVKSLSYYDRPRRAYRLIPHDMVFTTPEMVVAASQASSWANWSDLTRTILITEMPITNNINSRSPLAKDIQDLQWQTRRATSPGEITPSVFASHDSEDFNKTRVMLDYTRYWNQLAQTAVGLDYIHYTQQQPNNLNARGIYLGQTLRPTRDLILNAQIEPMEYKNSSPFAPQNWSPLLGNASATYTPNDLVSWRVLAIREIIETFPAFADRITDNQYGTSLTVSPLPYVQINGAYSRLNMSDSNIRNSYFLSSTLLVSANLGLSATGMIREYTDKFSSPDYFSPFNYKAGTFLLKLSRRLGAAWHYYLDGGLGRQFIVSLPGANTASSPTYQFGLGITGPITSWLVVNAYYADLHQASAYLGSSDYHYQYGGISFNIMM